MGPGNFSMLKRRKLEATLRPGKKVLSSARRKRKSCGGSVTLSTRSPRFALCSAPRKKRHKAGPPQKEEQTMSLKDFPDKKLLSELEVLRKIHRALREQKPFSLVRIGDDENIVLAQGKFLSNEELEQTYWVRDSRTGRKGVDLPNLTLRDRMLKGIKAADVVGICRQQNDEVSAPTRFKRVLTNKIFDYYGLEPRALCYVFCNRKM